MTNITDRGHKINTEPELEFTELVDHPKLSAASILGNLASWIEQDLAGDVFKTKRVKNATEFDLEMARRDGLKQVLAYITRLGAIDFIG